SLPAHPLSQLLEAPKPPHPPSGASRRETRRLGRPLQRLARSHRRRRGALTRRTPRLHAAVGLFASNPSTTHAPLLGRRSRPASGVRMAIAAVPLPSPPAPSRSLLSLAPLGNLPPPHALLPPDRPRAPCSPPASSLRRPP